MIGKAKVALEYISPICFLGIAAAANWFMRSTYWDGAFLSLSSLFGWAADENNSQNLKAVIEGVVNVLSFVPLCCQSLRRCFVSIQLKSMRKQCVDYIRDNMALMLSNQTGVESHVNKADLSIRMFKKRGHHLKQNDIDCANSNSLRKKLSFNIDRDEGLVSTAYKTKTVQYEINNGADDHYNLTPDNASIVQQLHFIVVVPIIKNDKVTSIIAIDSPRKLCKANADMIQISKTMQFFAYELHDLIKSSIGGSL